MLNSTYLNAAGSSMTAAAFYSLQAAYLSKSIGLHAAVRFTMKRAAISFNQALRLITLARQLIAVSRC